MITAIRDRIYDAADQLSWALGGLYQIWFAYREQHGTTPGQEKSS